MTSQSIDPTLSEPDRIALVTLSGLRLDLRQVTGADALLVTELFDGLSQEDMRFRFLSSLRHLPPDQLAAMIGTDHRHSEHMLAFHGDPAVLVASLMIVADQHMQEAEVAIAVRPEFKDRGIGWTLLKHATDLARDRGIRRLRSIESRANHQAMEVERALGFRVLDYEGDASLALVEVDLN